MPTYATPGVYYEAVDLDSGRINPLRTDIAAFVGIAERGPLHTPVPITTWAQYQSTFGNFIEQGYLAYALKAFFGCGVVRTNHGDRLAYRVRSQEHLLERILPSDRTAGSAGTGLRRGAACAGSR